MKPQQLVGVFLGKDAFFKLGRLKGGVFFYPEGFEVMILFLKHVEIEGPGLFSGFLKSLGFKTSTVALNKAEALPSLEECQAIISLGGPMNVYETDKYPFLLKEEKFLKSALSREIPILGICLGAQILAKTCGAKVKKADKKEVGWFEVKLTPKGKDDGLFNNLGEGLSVFQWHEDTFEVPEGAELLVQGTLCKNQAFRIGKSAWGLQFHPEMNKTMLNTWIDTYNEDINREKILFNYFKKQDV